MRMCVPQTLANLYKYVPINTLHLSTSKSYFVWKNTSLHKCVCIPTNSYKRKCGYTNTCNCNCVPIKKTCKPFSLQGSTYTFLFLLPAAFHHFCYSQSLSVLGRWQSQLDLHDLGWEYCHESLGAPRAGSSLALHASGLHKQNNKHCNKIRQNQSKTTIST